MSGSVQVAVVLLGVSLAGAGAQEPAAVVTSTNQIVSLAEEELTLSLPKLGVELKSPQTQFNRTGTNVDDGVFGELFLEPTNIAAENSALETGEQVVALTVPLNSLESGRATEVANAGGLSVSGPLVHVFHGSRPEEVPKRFLQLVNPFAPMEPTPITPSVPNEHPRAWAAIVGWNPGGSAFPDPRTHVLTLDQFSLSTSP